ncbi:MAG: Gfo/Idh/MocA family oxidoreductase, partial [Bryobacteraceae bacterium]
LRKILEDKEIDAVTVATCNHWHALSTIWACQAGKHVYVEKPVSHNVFEGRKMVEASRKYNRIVQGGTQRRSWGRFRKAMQLLQGGAIGDIYMSRTVLIQPRESIGFKDAQAPPAHLDWDLWLGPAKQQPYHPNLAPYNWHWFWEFGNGEMGNNGSHFLDILRWGTGKGLPSRIYSVGGRVGYKDQAQTPNTESATFTYEDGHVMQIDIRNFYTAEPQYEWHFYGSKGYLLMEEDWKGQRFDYKIYMGRSKSPEPDQGTMETLNHYGNFLEAVRSGSREKQTCEVDEARKTAALCHLAAISYRLKREIRFDPKTEKAIGDEEASHLLTRQYRKPFVVPEKV